MTDSMWAFQDRAGHRPGADLTGFKVEATDGAIGKVSAYRDEAGSSYLIVDSGIWILGRHVMLPAGTVTSVDAVARKIFVSRTKDDVRSSPEFDRDRHTEDPQYRERVGDYYGTPHA